MVCVLDDIEEMYIKYHNVRVSMFFSLNAFINQRAY